MQNDKDFWNNIFMGGQKYRPLSEESLTGILARAEHLSGKQPEKAADIGAGNGEIVFALAKRNIRVTAFDISDFALGKIMEQAQTEGVSDRVAIRNEDMNTAEFGNGLENTFDLIFFKLGVAFAQDRRAVLERIASMLRLHGVLVILTPVLVPGQNYDEQQTGISVPRAEFENELHAQFPIVEILSETGEATWPLVTYLCTKKSAN